VRRIHSSLVIPGILALTVGFGAACDNSARSARQAADEAASAAEQARDRAGEMASDAQRAAADIAVNAAEGVERASERLGAVAETVDVKAALMADPSVNASRIDVDADERTRVLTLSGTVPTLAERDMAALIAAGHAPGYRVENRLTVAPAA